MLEGIILNLIVGVLWGGSGVIMSHLTRHKVNFAAYLVVLQTGMSLCFGVFIVKWPLVLSGAATRVPELALVIGAAALLNMAAFFAMNGAFKRGHHGLTWTICQSAMVVSFAASIIIWHNRVPLHGYAGVGLVLATLVLLGLKKEEPGATAAGRWLSLVLLAFAAIGISQTLITMPSRWTGWHDAANLRVMFFSSVSGLGALTVVLVRRIAVTAQAVKLGAIGTLLFVGAQFSFYRSMDILERYGYLSIAFPLAVGVCIVTFALYSLVRLKEHFGPREIAGIVLGLAGIGLMAWK